MAAISDDDSTEPEKGVLLYSENKGDIESDINGGGIAGVISDKGDHRSDFEVVSEGQVSLNYDRSEKATILFCRNYGDVTVKNNYAGGIVGRAELGAVISCDNYGRIETLDGYYAGGIAGRSEFVVRNCHSMCEAVSERYAGGIAGIAHSMVNNICLSAVDPEGEYHGAVAGDTDNADLDIKDRGSISGNVFVFRDLGAINGVTESSEARAVSYEELLGMQGIPEEFKKMTVTFKDEGVTVKKVKVPYGGSLDISDFPEIGNASEGKFGYWEEKDLDDIRQNFTINAVYADYITSVASDNAEKPGMIISGRFFDGTALNMEEKEVFGKLPDGNELYKSVSFTIDNPYGIPDNAKYTVRYRTNDTSGKDAVLLYDSGKYVPAESRRDREYIVFDMDGAGSFYLAHTGRRKTEFAVLCAVAAAAGITILVVLISAFRKKKADGREQ